MNSMISFALGIWTGLFATVGWWPASIVLFLVVFFLEYLEYLENRTDE